MSYDIHLVDPVTKETLKLPYKHTMTGGTYAADYDEKTGEFTPKPIEDAWLNITYNYAHYYYDHMDKDLGIRKLYGMTGLDSIDLLDETITSITNKYKKPDGTWISTERKVTKHYRPDGTEITQSELLDALINHIELEYEDREVIEIIDEGNTGNYWQDTAANALRPLHQLKVLAATRPDGIWAGD